MIAMALNNSAMQRRRTVDDQAVRRFLNARAHLGQFFAHRCQAIGFFHAQFFGAGDDRLTFGLRGQNRQNWNLVDRARNDVSADLDSF